MLSIPGMLIVSLLFLCAALCFARGLKSWERDEKNKIANIETELEENVVLNDKIPNKRSH